MRLLARTTRITRAGLDLVLAELAPKIVKLRCVCCGCEASKTSPVYYPHESHCADNERYRRVAALIDEALRG